MTDVSGDSNVSDESGLCDMSLRQFWSEARAAAPSLPEQVPDAWAFGATPADAEELLSLVIEGTKTATASALWDYEAEGDRSLECWRVIHEAFWRHHGQSPRGFARDMPVVCERFQMVFPE